MEPLRRDVPFSFLDPGDPTQRQLAIAALIQHFWARTIGLTSTMSLRRTGEQTIVHANAGLSQSELPTTDRWANVYSAIVLDRWISEFAAHFGGLAKLSPGSLGERRASNMLFMLWSIARFGSEKTNTVRRRPSAVADIPSIDLKSMSNSWALSLQSITDREFENEFAKSFRPTFLQVVLDRCIVRSAIACHHLADSDLSLICRETELDTWANQLGNLQEACEALRRGHVGEPRAVLIAGPTTTGKSAVAWELAEKMNGVAISSDAFQIFASPPFSLGVGLPARFPPQHIRAALYRAERPAAQRPTPEHVADRVADAVDEAQQRGLPVVIEGGSSLTATALWRRGVISHTIVLDANPYDVKAQVRIRMLSEDMSPGSLLAEAKMVRANGLESTWIAKESLIYPTVFQRLDGAISENEMLDRITRDWERLVDDQQQWFAELRAKIGVVTMAPTEHTFDCVAQIVSVQ